MSSSVYSYVIVTAASKLSRMVVLFIIAFTSNTTVPTDERLLGRPRLAKIGELLNAKIWISTDVEVLVKLLGVFTDNVLPVLVSDVVPPVLEIIFVEVAAAGVVLL